MDQEQQVDKVLSEVPPPEQVDPKEPPHVTLHPDAEGPNIALGVLAVVAVLAVLRWASAFFIPLMLGFVFYYALAPVVEALARARIPRALGAGVLILSILGAAGASVYALTDDANELLDSLPVAAQKLRDVMRKRTGDPDTPLETVQKAAAELERAAEDAKTGRPGQRGVQRVVVEKPAFDIRDHLWSGTIGLLSLVGQITLVTFLTYFLLLSGDTFRRKMVKITGPGLAQKKLTVQALDEINAQIQRYLLVQLLASIGVGLATGIAFAMLGLEHAAVWGVAAGVLNLVPYIGSILVTGAASLVAFMQFGQIEPALAVGGASLLINTVEGYLLVPWLTSKASRMNAVSVFIGVLAWGWLWGVWGLLLGIPIMMVIKAVCDRVDHLKPVGELLGT
ncbi:AI-2E family transporter [Ramlibacter tataouinensis]|uniref:Candidate membrane protein n=1 Tax=Ramlibacter tataouinensis (strain ATCC BAA-407 / DSM 14655 / LMG 21543 / TTB310) TaxID=365046 RepID=F5Y5U3_RAMTT|nr:AI-2E family transporter [Ramlibacter tataouinensis]AEG93977.1 candidate membrane protein [Ramlibacter tataouinensis TTB310]